MNSETVKFIARASLALTGLTVVLCSNGSEAHAQAWLPDRNYTTGPGIRTGDLEIHPGIALRGGYDTNIYRGDGDAQPIEGGGVLSVTPHLNISTLGQQRMREGEDRPGAVRPSPMFAFNGGFAATYLHYFVDDGPRNVEADTDFALRILPGRPVNFDVGMLYVRNIRPFTQRAGLNQSRDMYVFNVVAPRARLNFGSRSQVLTGYVGYAPRLTLFKSNVFDYLDNVQHGAQGGAAWRFLPNTALLYDAQFDWQSYLEGDTNERQNGTPLVLSENKRFRTRLGINGALTRTLSLTVLAGYAVGFYDDVRLSEFEDFVGEASLTYGFGPGLASRFRVGYQRDVQASGMGGWVRQDRGYVALSALLGRVFALTVEAGAAYLSYGRLLGFASRDANGNPLPLGTEPPLTGLGVGGDTSRNDVRLDGAIRGEYRVTNWLAFTADVSVQAIVTDFEYAPGFTVAAIPDPAEFVAVMAFGGVRAHY